MTQKEEELKDLEKLNQLIDISRHHILNTNKELELTDAEISKTAIDSAFEDINKYTKYNIPTSHSGNNKLYNNYIRKFLNKKTQQIFNSPKVIIYAQIPEKLQGTIFSFSPSKYRKAIKHFIDRNAQYNNSN
jgi:hypothetical protein